MCICIYIVLFQELIDLQIKKNKTLDLMHDVDEASKGLNDPALPVGLIIGALVVVIICILCVKCRS